MRGDLWGILGGSLGLILWGIPGGTPRGVLWGNLPGVSWRGGPMVGLVGAAPALASVWILVGDW